MIDECNKLLGALNQPFEFTIKYDSKWWLYANNEPVIYSDDVMYVWSRAMAITILITNKNWDELPKWFKHMELVNMES